MDYEKFRKELDTFRKNEKDISKLSFSELDGPHSVNDKWMDFGVDGTRWVPTSDPVNSPSHYTRGRVEVIEVIEDAVKDASEPYDAVLQGNTLKYLLRLWVKENPLQDAKKARWYLDRLIERLEND